MVNLDDSIGKILLDLQRNDPETFQKLIKRAKEENPEIFEDETSDEISQTEE
jgi:hypothetical protein